MLQPQLHRKFEVSLGHRRSYLKNKQNQQDGCGRVFNYLDSGKPIVLSPKILSYWRSVIGPRVFLSNS